MHSLSEAEILVLVEALQPLVGAHLNEVVVSDKGCGLGFWTQGHLVWVWCDMNTWFPVVLPLTQVPERSRKPSPPLLLFLKAHFVGQRLHGIEQVKELGRALRLVMSDSDSTGSGYLDVYLWPHGQNVLAVADEKKVYFRRPSTGGAAAPVKAALKGPSQSLQPPRDIETLLQEWDGSRKDHPRRTGAQADAKKPMKDERLAAAKLVEKERLRISRAIEKIEGDVLSKRSNPWREVGQWVTANQSLDVPGDWRIYVDQRRSLAWNIESIFSKAKDVERKVGGAEARIAELRQDLWRLDHLDDPMAFAAQRKSTKEPPRGQSLSRKKPTTARFRTVRLSERFEVWVGRSGRENIELLRAARPWHYWIHLRDYPGPHAILPRTRGLPISDQVFQEAARALADLQFGAGASSHKGDVLSFIVAEVRHVRPIKGDRLGRVQVQNGKSLALKY